MTSLGKPSSLFPAGIMNRAGTPYN